MLPTCDKVPDGENENEDPAKHRTRERKEEAGEYDGDVQDGELVADERSIEEHTIHAGHRWRKRARCEWNELDSCSESELDSRISGRFFVVVINLIISKEFNFTHKGSKARKRA